MYNRLYNWHMQLQKEAKRMWRRMSVLKLQQHYNTVHDKYTEIDELVIEESQGHNIEINDEVEELMDWVFGEDAHSRVSNNIDSEEEDTSM